MADMLVKLYGLPDVRPYLDQLRAKNIVIRQAAPSEKHVVSAWAGRHFSEVWAAECDVALSREPVSCYIAVELDPAFVATDDPYHLPQEKVIGFACFNASSKGMFGPTGVDQAYRGREVGKALLLQCLHAMAAERYAYAVIGWVGPVEFYVKAVGATLIEDSAPGIYRGKLVG